MKYPAYPQYRPSKIEWVQTVPVDWEECSAKMNYLMQLGKMLQNEPSGLEDVEITYLKALHVNWNRVTTEDLPKMWASPSELENYAVHNGDLLVCEGGEVGRAATINGLEEPAIIQNALHRLRGTLRGEVRYFAYLLKHIADAGWFAILCNKATIAHLTGDKLGAMYMPVPSVTEQQQISMFLDWKSGQIDALIAKKKELLEKLKEKRLAVITQAVTKGLNPAASLRNSGSPWLGDVPAHWEVKRARFAMLVNPSAPRLRALNPEDEVSFVPMEAVGVQGGLNLEQTRVLADISSGYTEFQDGDVVVAKITPCFENGKAALASGLTNGVAYGTTELHVLRAETSLDQRFLFYVTISDIFLKLGESEMYGAGGQKRVPPEFIKDYRIPLPPLAEQIVLADNLDAEMSNLDALAAKVERAVERLTEYRTALITAATTGKIDVRNAKIGVATQLWR